MISHKKEVKFITKK